jgi:hypothetical protein
MATEIGPIDVKLTASGIKEVLKGFTDILAKAQEFEDKLNKTSKRGSDERTKTSEEEGKKRTRSSKKAFDEEGAMQDAHVKAHRSWAKQRETIMENSAKLAGRIAKQQADAEIREARRSHDERQRFASQLAGRVGAGVSSVIGGAGRLAGAALALGGGFSVAGAMQQAMAVSRSATALSIASDVPGQPGSRVSAADATAKAQALSKQFNVAPETILEGMHEIVAKTGKGGMSMDLIGEVTKIAKAEGVDPKELATAMADAAAQNPNLSTEELTELMRILVGQGKTGAVEIKDLAKVLPIAMAKAVEYEGNQGNNQVKLASLAQVAIRTTASPEEAATSIKNLSTDILKHEKEFDKMLGKKGSVRGDGGKIRDINEILAEALGKTGGDVFKMKGMFGERAGAIINGLAPIYSAAEKNKKGSGEQAVKDYLADLNKQRVTEADIQRHLQEVQESDAEKVSKAMNDLQRAVATDLIPALLPLITKIGEMAPAFGLLLQHLVSLGTFLADHPWVAGFMGLGLIVGKAMTESIMEAAIGNMIKSSMGTSLAGLGGLGVALGIAALAAMAFAETMDLIANAQKSGHDNGAKEDAEMDDINAKLANKDLDPTPKAALLARKAKLEENKKNRKKEDAEAPQADTFGAGLEWTYEHLGFGAVAKGMGIKTDTHAARNRLKQRTELHSEVTEQNDHDDAKDLKVMIDAAAAKKAGEHMAEGFNSKVSNNGPSNRGAEGNLKNTGK